MDHTAANISLKILNQIDVYLTHRRVFLWFYYHLQQTKCLKSKERCLINVSCSAYSFNLQLTTLPWEWCHCCYLVLILLNILAEAYTISQQRLVKKAAKGSNLPSHRSANLIILTFPRQKILVGQQRALNWTQVLKQRKRHNRNLGTPSPSPTAFLETSHTITNKLYWQVLKNGHC